MSGNPSNRLLTWCLRSANLIAAVILVAVVACVFGSPRWNKFIGLPSAAAFTFTLVSLIAGALILRRNTFMNERRLRMIFVLTALFAVIEQILIIAYIELDYTQMTFDAGHVVRAAMALVSGGNVDHVYFALYPYTQCIVYVWAWIFKIISLFGVPMDVRALMVFNAVFIDVSIFFTYCTAKMFLSRKWLYLFGIACAVSPVFVLFVPICYSDTVVLPYLAGGIYLLFRHIELLRGELPEAKMGWIFPVAGGGALWLGFALKGCPVFAIATFLAYAFLALPHGRRWKTVAFILAGCILGIVTVSQIESQFGLSTHEQAERTRLPMTHYIMMGLKGLGNYHDEDVCYTRSFPTLEEKRKATVSKIRERLNEMGVSGVLKQLHKKVVFTWGHGNCGASAYIGDNDHLHRRTFVHEFVLSDGRFRLFTNLIADSVYYLLSLFIVFGALKDAWSCRVSPCWPLRMFLVACILFLLIWETHPRYTFHIRMTMMLLGIMEAYLLTDRRGGSRDARHYSHA